MTKPRRFFCVGHYDGGKTHTPVHLEPKTMPEAQAAMRWQNNGERWAGAVYEPIEGKPGFMRLVSPHKVTDDNPAEVELCHLSWTDCAWAEFLACTWEG
jgi:hypothetical protein